jgi:hypothetical protein
MVDLNNAYINYEEKFVFTAAALSLSATWGIADNIIRQLHMQIQCLPNYMQIKEFMSVVIKYIQLRIIKRSCIAAKNNKQVTMFH